MRKLLIAPVLSSSLLAGAVQAAPKDLICPQEAAPPKAYKCDPKSPTDKDAGPVKEWLAPFASCFSDDVFILKGDEMGATGPLVRCNPKKDKDGKEIAGSLNPKDCQLGAPADVFTP